MKIVRLILFLLTIQVVGAAQNVCELELKDAPVLANLKLGLSSVETRSILGKSLKIKAKKRGEKTFFQNFVKKSPPSVLSDARALYLRFLDDKLYQIEIFYQREGREPAAPRTFADLTGALSEKFNLPAATWRNVKGKATLQCRDFTLDATDSLNLRIQLTDSAAAAAALNLREEKAKKSENKKPQDKKS